MQEISIGSSMSQGIASFFAFFAFLAFVAFVVFAAISFTPLSLDVLNAPAMMMMEA
jgi:hypothetical protein